MLRPENYRAAEDFLHQVNVLVFEAKGREDFDWLEQMILETGYYERPGIWSFDLDWDKKLMAEIMATFYPQRSLELGCSNGAILKGLAEMGIAGEGIEISAMAKKGPSQTFKTVSIQGISSIWSFPRPMTWFTGSISLSI